MTVQNRTRKGREPGRGDQEALPATPAARREAAASGSHVGHAHSPKDILIEDPFLPSSVNLKDVCLWPTEPKGH